MIKARFSSADTTPRQNIILVGEGKADVLSEIFEVNYNDLYLGEEKSIQRARYLGDKYFILGLGKNTDPANLKSLGEYYSKNLGYELESKTTAITFPQTWSVTQCELFLIGFLSGIYQINEASNKLHFLSSEDTVIQISDLSPEIWSKALDLAEGRNLARRWLDRGQNQKTAPKMAAFLTDWAKELQIDIRILNRAKCEELGLDAYLAVNQGSAHDAHFTIIEFKPPNSRLHIGLVGKCITFDTGGISIKSSTNLHYMKSDMGGATAVLGAVHAIVKQGLPVQVTAMLPITDNAVDRTAYTPSDIISSHAGHQIEVIDTDAEGRLTLADGLSYTIKEYAPDVVIDLATLTGSAVRTLGTAAAALFSDNEDLQGKLVEAGLATGEKLWRLPMWPEYRRNLESDVADIKNYSGKPLSGASDAAVFLKDFTHGHPVWAHLDIAGVAFGKTHFGKDKSATAYGVHLLFHLIKGMLSEKSPD